MLAELQIKRPVLCDILSFQYFWFKIYFEVSYMDGFTLTLSISSNISLGTLRTFHEITIKLISSNSGQLQEIKIDI